MDSITIRLRAVVTLRCTSTRHDRTSELCGRDGVFEAETVDDAMTAAKGNGWRTRRLAARCPLCGQSGRSFGPASTDRLIG